ncbi:competence type IV pilus minor pilin ComGG [Bacillota bacterium Lsc_1132]
MIRDQKGFTYPLTLSLLIVFLFFFSIRVEQLLTERKFMHNAKIMLVQEYYMLTTEKKMEKVLQSGDGTSVPTSGSFVYREGQMNYQIEPPSGNTQKITFTLQLTSGEVTYGYGYYDINTKNLVKWIEKN